MMLQQETCEAIIFLVGHWPPLGEETRGKAGTRPPPGAACAVAALVINSCVTSHECCCRQPCSKLSGNEIKQPKINVSSLSYESLGSRNSFSNL